MGVDTNAIVFYGFDLGEEEGIWQSEDDIEDLIMKKMGYSAPIEPYDNGNESVVALYKNWWAKKREVLKTLGCEIGCHGSDGYPGYFVAVSSKILTAYRGEPKLVSADFLAITNEDITKLVNFCKLLEIPWQLPKWMLCSYWG
jgi:hypothetical protein